MTRVKRGVTANKRRKKVLSQTKGFRFGRANKEREAKTALLHAGAYAFAHRRDKKNDMRALWNVKINAAAREDGISYSKLIGALKKKNIMIDRKILALIAETNPESFKRITKSLS